MTTSATLENYTTLTDVTVCGGTVFSDRRILWPSLSTPS